MNVLFVCLSCEQVKKCLHANAARSCNDQLTTVQFHPSAQVVMTAGLDQSISLFQVLTLSTHSLPPSELRGQSHRTMLQHGPF